MKVSALKYTVLTWVSGLTMLILFLMPFHAVLTVWGSSIFGHYTALRLWKEVLLVLCVAGVLYLLATDHKIRSHTLSRRLVWLILGYIALNLTWGLLAYVQHDVTAKAVGYGLIVNLRFLVFFLVTWAVALRLARMRSNWEKLVLWPAAGVIFFGLLQVFILPHDFLRHLGYSDLTIPAYETINNNQNFVRIASTLRGANPLGAYLLIPISLLVVLLIRKGRNWRHVVFLACATVVLFFTFSRSAWVGALLSVITILLASKLSKNTRNYVLGGAGLLVVTAAIVTLLFRNSIHYENFVFHTQKNSPSQVTSNEGHLEALRGGLNDLKHQPLGEGPGTAGPASFYNDKPPRVAENYYAQIGQELGWLGLGLFLLINAGVGFLLWSRRADPLALSLFGALVGLSFINLLSHAWTDDTLAYVWWGLAGIAMAPDPRAKHEDKA